MNTIKNQLRQGDVLLHPIKEIPLEAKIESVEGDIVLANGEVTGHAHRIKNWRDRVEVYAFGEKKYLSVKNQITIDHEEHGVHDSTTKTLQPGLYEVKRQVEVWYDEVRQVAD